MSLSAKITLLTLFAPYFYLFSFFYLLHKIYQKALGIGKQLLSHSLDEGKRLNLKIIALIFSENKTNLRLFLKFGFKKWDKLPSICLMDNEYKSVIILGLKL